MKNVNTSKTVTEAKEIIALYRTAIDSFESNINYVYKTIDWSYQRGQGKRIAKGLVVGSMSNAPRGKKQYCGIDYSEYITDQNKEDFRYLTVNQIYRYTHARQFGCNHIEARLYAVL